MSLYGGIEAGGTKIVCAVGSSPEEILLESRFPTTTPEETIGKIINFFLESEQKVKQNIESIGLASFGPVDLDQNSKTYGYITSTPKPGWAFTSFLKEIQNVLQKPMFFDTDTNGAVIGEHKWGAGQGLNDLFYITIGTGIGGGVLSSGKTIHGLLHPEIGHMLLPHDRTKDPYEGFCPFHKDCLEGLASGPSMNARWGTRAENLPADHPAWDLEAEYIALALHNVVLSYAPQRLILGGGVMQQELLFPKIRKRLLESLAGYIQSPYILEDINNYVVPPLLGQKAGVLGAIAMARFAEEYY